MPPSSPKDPCSSCHKNVNKNHRAILCDICDQWIHLKCNLLNRNDYKKLQNDPSPFFCLPCSSTIFPFGCVTNNEFYSLITKGISFPDPNDDSTLSRPLSPQIQNHISNLNLYLDNYLHSLNEGNDDCISPINCNYFSPEEFDKAKFQSNTSFSTFHLNIHSIQKHIDTLRTLITSLESDQFQFDVIAISESKLKPNCEPTVDISIDNFHAPISTPSEASKGGVLLYVNKKLNFKPRPDLHIYESKTLESAFVEIINPKKANDVIGVIYRHPSMAVEHFNDLHIRPLVSTLGLEKNKNIHLAGDFNVNLLNLSSHPLSSEFFDIMCSNHLLPSISLPTKLNSSDKHTLIDNIFTNCFNPDIISGNILLNISDGHLPSFMLIPKPNHNHLPKKHNLFKRNIKNFNPDDKDFPIQKRLMSQKITQLDWNHIMESDKSDANIAFDNFWSSLEPIIDEFMPLEKVTNKEHKRRFKPWITQGLMNCMRRRDKLLHKYINTKNPLRKQAFHSEYKTLRNQIVQLTTHSKNLFYKKYFETNCSNLKKIWSGIKSITNIKQTTSSSPSSICDNDKIVTDPTEISNCFIKTYSSVADDILNKRPYNGDGDYKKYLPPSIPNSIRIDHVDDDEICVIISACCAKKSSGPFSIPSFILYHMQKELAKPLSMIANISLTTGIHPEKLKIAKIIPFFKKGSKLKTSNYRPISLLSNINKIIEKMVYSRVFDFAQKHNLFYNLQFGFRPKYSTAQTLINITENIRDSLDNGIFSCAVFVDFQKAFDTVNHNILLSKLAHYGIRGSMNNWFKSYLSGRKQFVSVNGFDSEMLDMKHGVPQGSVLGPLLFLLYINDLHNSIKYSKTYHFADDTNLLITGKNFYKLQSNLNKDLKGLYKWLLANKISLNAAKTELVIFRKPSWNRPISKIKIAGTRIAPSTNTKYLGIFLDEFLNGSAHCDQLYTKLRRANGMIAKARHHIKHIPEHLKTIYHSIFSSHMIYGCQSWGLRENKFVKKIQVLQNNALRLISFAPSFRDHVSHIYKEFEILKLNDFITMQNLLFVHDYFHNKLPPCFNGYFALSNSIHSHCTRTANQGQLFVPHIETIKYGFYSVKHQASIAWNSFSSSYPDSNFVTSSRFSFKQLITKHFLSIY